MKTKRIFISTLVATLLLALTGISLADAAREIQVIPIDKGIELYSWKDDDNKWVFVMMTGTNRNKSTDEVKKAKDQIKGVVALKQAFGKLAKNKYVSWSNRGLKGFEYPPKAIRQEIVAAAEKAEIDLSVSDED